ncbi:uncharacterized protein K452DRAFT_273702 [Aplosporella prunicola CBS 121167]|uniref:Transcription factor IIIC subunit 5 HTH domain-containing protein n=1 Tax=Aplosporella prunicola CBS 121167 TaxID=1176127 RepID=A0A6A6B9V3_9PEZI|nr:uncharacterized protein K452DRAFT_273702 [Aplosporella prunicola CBS 121167]KAF2140143.1 hypothetical protein K452DRAFT_273702 [Aplosporella prunicola CBS 121167]
MDGLFAPAAAPSRPVPPRAVVSIEHPCLVRNIDNGLKSLGGGVALEKFLHLHDVHKTIGASLRPDDAMAKPVMSTFVRTQNLLVKLSLPKRTGRKRKRGSDDPWTADPLLADATSHTDPSILLRSLRDNPDGYGVELVGHARETHRFRSLPDFQYATSASPLAHMLRENLLPFEYSKLKHFNLDDRRENGIGGDVGPSPQFTNVDVPFNYVYRQNPAVKYAKDAEGQAMLYNPTAIRKFIMHQVSIDAESVLNESPVPLPPEETLDPHIQSTIQKIRALMEERPIMTKRYLMNHMVGTTDDVIKSSYAYVGFSFRSGPWRDTLVKFGCDPRTDPKYRVFQTVMFKIILPSEKESSNDPNKWMDARNVWRRQAKTRTYDKLTYLFDGKEIIPDGKIWQVCDITDPQLKRLIDTDNLRKECNIKSDGWFQNGTWAKVKVLMRDKIGIIMKGGTPNDDEYKRVMEFPDIITKDNIDETTIGRDLRVSKKESRMLTDIRNMAKLKYNRPLKTGQEDIETADSPEASQSAMNNTPGETETQEPLDHRLSDAGLEQGDSYAQVASPASEDLEDGASEDEADGVDALMGGTEEEGAFDEGEDVA